jgi:hypothetical protein
MDGRGLQALCAKEHVVNTYDFDAQVHGAQPMRFLSFIVLKELNSKKLQQSQAPVAHTCNPSTKETEIRRIVVEASPGK